MTVSFVKVADPPRYSPIPPPKVIAVLPDTTEFVSVSWLPLLLTQMPPQSLPCPTGAFPFEMVTPEMLALMPPKTPDPISRTRVLLVQPETQPARMSTTDSPAPAMVTVPPVSATLSSPTFEFTE